MAGVLQIDTYAHPAVCNICFLTKGIPLTRCVFSTKNFNPTNLVNHVKNRHSHTDCPHIFKSKDKKLQAQIEEETTKKNRKSAGGIPAGMAGFLTKSNTNKNALEEAQMLMYRFMNKAGVAIRQGAQPEFHKMLTYCVTNSQYLKPQSENIKIGQRKYASKQVKSFPRQSMC